MNSSKLLVVAFVVAALTTLANAAMLICQWAAPAQPIYVAKELVKNREFKKAVETIAEDVARSQDYVDERPS
jgi:hypothetical protein